MSTPVTPLPGFYQIGYVTTDFDRAMKSFRDSHGVKEFLELRDIRYPSAAGREAHCHVGMAYLGGMQIEVIQPIDGDVGIYRDALPAQGYALRFHHVSRMVDSEEEFNRLLETYRKEGRGLPIVGEAPNTRFFYADFRPEFGHYVEYIHYTPEGLADERATVPRN
jgi:Glyoxalase/Bleomycin resistance protein/Dioxygenase superfamily